MANPIASLLLALSLCFELGIDQYGIIDTDNIVPVSAPPDGGLIAWLQVLGSFFVHFNTWGSTQSFLLLFVGVVAGPPYDRDYLRSLLITGTALVVVGMMMSFCTQYWHVVLAQAVCIGLGTGFLYIPSIALIPQYFYQDKALAQGFVVSGSGFGGVLFPITFQQLQPRVGFAWTSRAMSPMSLAKLSVSTAVLRRREKPSTETRSLLEPKAFKEGPYVLYCAALFFSNVAFFTPVFYMQSYALQHGLQGRSIALYLVAIMNACSVLGRLAPSLIAETIGPVQTLVCSTLFTGITVFSWIGTETGWSNIVFVALAFFGFFSGGVVVLPPVVLTSFTPDMSRLGTRLGMCPIGGLILRSPTGYLGIQLYAGVVVLTTASFPLGLRFALTGRELIAKA
ncbi:major facilitator superfamily domain-containing protein [Xylariales sp. AK1849]|nr:major facilitator superfamily domain-containing protein [Xylariales sp. AK1849]